MLESTPHPSSTDMPLPVAPEATVYNRRQQLWQELLDNNELLLKNRLEVRHLMTRDPMVVAPTMTFDEIALVMQRQRLHHLLVGGLGGEILGVISDQDLHNRRGATAQQLMQSPALTIATDTPLSPAITYLINEKTSCLVVLDRGQLCGILTTIDFAVTLQCMLQMWLRLAQVLQQDSTWTTELDKITATLDRNLTPAQLAEQVGKVQHAIQRQVSDLVNMVDLRTDVLTDICNRRGLEQVLDMLLAVKTRFGQPLSMVVVAVDHYDQIKEGCGQMVAHRLLKAVVRLIEQSVADTHFVARNRDDSIAVVMPQTGLEEAETFCARLRNAARKNRELKIELRIRTSAVTALSGEDTSQFLGRAEAAIG